MNIYFAIDIFFIIWYSGIVDKGKQIKEKIKLFEITY